MGFLQQVLLSCGHAEPGLHLADLLLPGRQLAPHLLQSLGVLLYLTLNALLKLLQKLLLSFQLLLQFLGLASQLWDARLKLLGFRGTSLCSQQPTMPLCHVSRDPDAPHGHVETFCCQVACTVLFLDQVSTVTG